MFGLLYYVSIHVFMSERTWLRSRKRGETSSRTEALNGVILLCALYREHLAGQFSFHGRLFRKPSILNVGQSQRVHSQLQRAALRWDKQRNPCHTMSEIDPLVLPEQLGPNNA